MVRYDGPLTKYRRADRWKQQVKERRAALYRLRLVVPRPLSAPPASRRRMALLWLIAVVFDGALDVNWMYRPPMTDDMKWLLRRGYLQLQRRRVANAPNVRRTVLLITPSGTAVIDSQVPNEADIRWIEAAYANDLLM